MIWMSTKAFDLAGIQFRCRSWMTIDTLVHKLLPTLFIEPRSSYLRKNSSFDHPPLIPYSWDFNWELLIAICSSLDLSMSLDETQGPIYDLGPLSLQIVFHIFQCFVAEKKTGQRKTIFSQRKTLIKIKLIFYRLFSKNSFWKTISLSLMCCISYKYYIHL